MNHIKDKIVKNALNKTGKINHHFINRLTEFEINQITELTNLSPNDTPIKIRIKMIIEDIKEYPKCIVCDNPVRPHFKGLTLLNTCSKECDYENRVNKTKESNLETYGVESTNQLDSIKEKQRSSMVKNYGVEYYTQTNEFTEKSDKIKKEKYNNPKFVNPKKGMKTKLEKYGNENYNNHEKYIETCIEKYGVEHVMQDKVIFEKQQSKCYGSKRYKHLYYRGSYELLFIKEFEKRFHISDLENCFSIKYELDGKTKIYFPDFLIKNKNVIIEIKSSWTYDNNGMNINLRNINNKKWEAAESLDDYTFLPLKSKHEIILWFELFDKKMI
jgi:hypothetical protein